MGGRFATDALRYDACISIALGVGGRDTMFLAAGFGLLLHWLGFRGIFCMALLVPIEWMLLASISCEGC